MSYTIELLSISDIFIEYLIQVLLVNVFGGAVILVFSFLSIFLLYAILRYLNLHRVTVREEKIGKKFTVAQRN